MSELKTLSTVDSLAAVMFTVADPDAACAFYTEKLDFKVRADVRFGENGENRWLEVQR
ncbi:VOC family protein [Tomitella gaofuii]|uniref:VOC family protein n=1 Tax=Tomitella gaofuii TaxID=2760083 RepID=UPI0015FD5C33|nr:VOC family protein [Tomitella gaofuii]